MRFELYTVGTSPPAAVWAVVGDPHRLPEWTDADEVASVDPDPLEVGSELAVAVDGQIQRWRVVTLEKRLVEARRKASGDPVAVGVRVVADPRGSRIVMAGAVEPSSLLGGLRARLGTGPKLRRRLERWANEAMTRAGRVS